MQIVRQANETRQNVNEKNIFQSVTEKDIMKAGRETLNRMNRKIK